MARSRRSRAARSRKNRRRSNQSSALPVPVARTFFEKVSFTFEDSVTAPSGTKAEAVYHTWPLNPSTVSGMATAIGLARFWRVVKVEVLAEPATATCTLHTGVMCSDTNGKKQGYGFSELFKRLRYCQRAVRSPVGGNIQSVFSTPMKFLSGTTGNTNSLDVPAVLIAVTDVAKIDHSAWFEIVVHVEIVRGLEF